MVEMEVEEEEAATAAAKVEAAQVEGVKVAATGEGVMAAGL